MFDKLIKSVFIMVLCGIAVVLSVNYAEALSLRSGSVDIDHRRGYSPAFFGDLFSKEHDKRTEQQTGLQI